MAVDDPPSDRDLPLENLKEKIMDEPAPTPSGWTYESLKKRIGNWRDEEIQKRKDKQKHDRRHEPARAYQFGNTVSSQLLTRLFTDANSRHRSLLKTKMARSSRNTNFRPRGPRVVVAAISWPLV